MILSIALTRSSLPVQKMSTDAVDAILARYTFKTQEAFAVCRYYAALLGDCPVSEFKHEISLYMRSAEYLSLPVEAKNELKLLRNWR